LVALEAQHATAPVTTHFQSAVPPVALPCPAVWSSRLVAAYGAFGFCHSRSLSSPGPVLLESSSSGSALRPPPSKVALRFRSSLAVNIKPRKQLSNVKRRYKSLQLGDLVSS